MANKALWEVLENIKISTPDEVDTETLHDAVIKQMEGYAVDVWDHNDYAKSDLVESIGQWISDINKGKVQEDLQIRTWWTEDGEGCFTVAALKTKEV